MKKIIIFLKDNISTFFLMFLIPFLSFASEQDDGGSPASAPTSAKDIKSLIKIIGDILNNYVVPLLIGIAVVYFLAGLLSYFGSAGNEDKRKESIQKMTWGIIALFVMISVWGLVNVLSNTFNLDISTPKPPVFQFPD